MLGSENWEEDFDDLRHLVKEFIIAVWEVRKQKLYSDDSYPGQLQHQSSAGDRLELGVGLVSRVSLVSYMVRVRAMLCMLVFVMCVAPPTHVGVWSMAGQPFYYYYYSAIHVHIEMNTLAA